MKITNTQRIPVGLPSGQVLEPGVATNVQGWAELKKGSRAVAGWVERGVLTEQAGGVGEQTSGGQKGGSPDEKAELQGKLDALKVDYDKRAGVAKLRELLAEAEKKAAEQAGGEG